MLSIHEPGLFSYSIAASPCSEIMRFEANEDEHDSKLDSN